MDKIDYLHPTAIAQIKAVLNGDPVPDNTDNRDGHIHDVRYLTPYAVEQIREACGDGSSAVATYGYIRVNGEDVELTEETVEFQGDVYTLRNEPGASIQVVLATEEYGDVLLEAYGTDVKYRYFKLGDNPVAPIHIEAYWPS